MRETFQGTSLLKHIFSDGDDLRTDSVAGKESDVVSLFPGGSSGASHSKGCGRRLFGESSERSRKLNRSDVSLQSRRHFRIAFVSDVETRDFSRSFAFMGPFGKLFNFHYRSPNFLTIDGTAYIVN